MPLLYDANQIEESFEEVLFNKILYMMLHV